MTLPETLELIAGIVLFVAGIWLYRKRGKEDPRHGSHTAILMFAVALIMIIHSLDLLEVTGLGTRG
jgi:hypothetical protein